MTRRTAQNADLANMAQATIKGRAAGAGTGVPVDLTATEVNTIIGGVYLSTVAVDATLTGDGTLGSPLSTLGIANRVMVQNTTLANGYCWILSGYVDTVTYTITLDGDARLEVI